MKKKILFLTNLHNSDIEEDLFLSEYLGKYFDVMVCHPLESKKHVSKTDLILIRNIWPTHEYKEKLSSLFTSFQVKNIKTYNPQGKGDWVGKIYLTELYRKGHPVIPTISKKEDLQVFGSQEFFFIKPLYGGSSKGCKKVTKQELLGLNLTNHIIQPFIDIQTEISFFYIDNKFSHALCTANKNERWNLKPFEPSKEEIAFAQQFVKWNNLPYGVQRIDACRTSEGKLLLMEIEDFCPYLSLLDIDRTLRDKFLDNFIKSLKKVIKKM